MDFLACSLNAYQFHAIEQMLNRLWYFREDVGLNLHHWHWHLVYPHDCDTNVVDKDRRGELFYYLHKQVRFVLLSKKNWTF